MATPRIPGAGKSGAQMRQRSIDRSKRLQAARAARSLPGETRQRLPSLASHGGMHWGGWGNTPTTEPIGTKQAIPGFREFWDTD